MAARRDIFAGRKLLVGVTGGIAAYKTAVLASALVQRGAAVKVIMTEAATKFVGPATFQALTGNPVYLDMWAATTDWHSSHIGLADWTEGCVVAPATANMIGKLACGIADDLLSTTLLTLEAPVLIAPAMNVRMWRHPVVRDNVARLKKLGYHFVGPESGRLACGDVGPGRMSEPEDIVAALAKLMKPGR
jgi:phosphopantothenoylcysteine decarboxylase/phosphopantothenate--cysteine ligase